MITSKLKAIVLASSIFISHQVLATENYNTDIPSSIMTPNTVQTSIGELNFKDGAPTAKTAQKLYDNLDTLRSTEVFLNAIPMASIEALRVGHAEIGSTSSNQVVVFDNLMDSNPLFLTGNTDTVYASVFLDLEKDGPTVIEVPEGMGPTTVNDAFFRFVTDLGIVGPDKGKGGKYLILPPGYEGEVPEGYFVSQSTSYTNWFIARGFLKDGKTDAAVKAYKENLKIYPLAKKDDQPKMEFISGSGKSFNTIHANDEHFYTEIKTVLDKEPISFIDPELRGLMSSIGIQKNKPFSPDERMKKLMKDGVAIGNATARSLYFQPRDKKAYIYEDRLWKTAFIGKDYQWLVDKGEGGRNLDARSYFFYVATVNTPAMALKLIEKGSQYALLDQAKDGEYFDGGKHYKLNIPANVPAKNFWSIVAYDTQTRSELQTSQPLPSKNNQRDDFIENEDGSVDLYFGPTAPKGKEANWIETVPGKGWFTILRLYGPQEAWYDQTWKPSDIEEVKL
ncbi:DUF1254 domain-containing protein [Vibrio crassostreae]|uniref:DUF1254 domain-containing protein n=1 Tax=Vibrio crassostreae TaxID=246167 RepID=UPI000F46DABD|nr:DUF1254 domain-containing protein [Vibrio crassostreae]ROR19036.1 hypothetical protein EDB36_101180 [Vibrio crassostreae]CAK1829601.1 DUF1254 domain-containing protein [Vibrio crassostreae]CAK2299982.1 DUF1254 domain-containing protein [Vibrio crassostreae]CAK2302003.1 DUF1254 domain-containing protein [Vibrio crassostreae]CAK3199492.1 DUF1254 domain-containing protein [Vibrio crassostreae]